VATKSINPSITTVFDIDNVEGEHHEGQKSEEGEEGQLAFLPQLVEPNDHSIRAKNDNHCASKSKSVDTPMIVHFEASFVEEQEEKVSEEGKDPVAGEDLFDASDHDDAPDDG
jgi:hypothetical protein